MSKTEEKQAIRYEIESIVDNLLTFTQMSTIDDPEYIDEVVAEVDRILAKIEELEILCGFL